jgi:hypothetical protein
MTKEALPSMNIEAGISKEPFLTTTIKHGKGGS